MIKLGIITKLQDTITKDKLVIGLIGHWLGGFSLVPVSVNMLRSQRQVLGYWFYTLYLVILRRMVSAVQASVTRVRFFLSMGASGHLPIRTPKRAFTF
jgi:hypothetical protein